MGSTAKQDVIAAGKWLAGERQKREGVANRKIAALATVLARRAGLSITIHQQQLSAIENSDDDSGPAKLPSWWGFVRDLIDSGQLDDMLQASAKPADPAPATGDRELFITDENGRKLGRLTLFGQPL